MNITPNRTKIIIEALFDRFDLQEASAYGEPGYTDPEQSILFANWNGISSAIQDYLTAAGFSLEWSDEWIINYDTGKAYRSSPTSYDWQPSFAFTENGELITRDDDASAWIEELKIWDRAQTLRALPDWISEEQIIKEGFTKYNSDQYESGWHPGQTDDPQEIVQAIFEQFAPCDVVFRLSEQSQFYQKFDAFYRQD